MTPDLLPRFEALGIRLAVGPDDQINLRIPKAVRVEAQPLVDELRARKPEVLDALRRRDANGVTGVTPSPLSSSACRHSLVWFDPVLHVARCGECGAPRRGARAKLSQPQESPAATGAGR